MLHHFTIVSWISKSSFKATLEALTEGGEWSSFCSIITIITMICMMKPLLTEGGQTIWWVGRIITPAILSLHFYFSSSQCHSPPRNQIKRIIKSPLFILCCRSTSSSSTLPFFSPYPESSSLFNVTHHPSLQLFFSMSLNVTKLISVSESSKALLHI